MKSVDLNCDLGESFGAWHIGADTEVMPHITSANIACGFHAGDPAVMRRTVAACLEHGVAIGAHPGFPDLVGFGRREMDVSPDDVHDLVVYQVGALHAFARSAGGRVQHVKPHGALYNMAARRIDLANAIVRAVRGLDESISLFGLAGSTLIAAAESVGLRAVHEVFADRAYLADGTLVPRSRSDATVHDVALAARRAVRMVQEGRVTSVDGPDLSVRADTICIHGDRPDAGTMVAAVRGALHAAGIDVRAPFVAARPDRTRS